MEIQTLNELVNIAKEQETKRIAVVAAADRHVLEALKKAIKQKIVDATLVGDEMAINQIAQEIDFKLELVKIINVKDAVKASETAVSLIREGKADILMKGMVSTSVLLKAVLDKEKGLRKGGTLSHVSFFESPNYHKLLCITDAAMNVSPDLDDKIAIINNAVEAYHKLGIELPKVAILGAVEVVNPKMEATVHAAVITQMNRRNQIEGCIIDGPLALDNIISKTTAEHKGIVSEVAGDADIIVTPDINVGNVLYKSLNFLGDAISAAVIMGAWVPIVLTSRSDSEKSKLMSIALAAAMK
ncbi:MAG: bifunctional enoyl-CoA hydratase/phosphate acetyltransferase [Bacteroidales bacterium]|nr:bifunctional enoyl-CoA hydratase/phosphate acetyltransferase [Bacteroidales bacterium]